MVELDFFSNFLPYSFRLIGAQTKQSQIHPWWVKIGLKLTFFWFFGWSWVELNLVHVFKKTDQKVKFCSPIALRSKHSGTAKNPNFCTDFYQTLTLGLKLLQLIAHGGTCGGVDFGVDIWWGCGGPLQMVPFTMLLFEYSLSCLKQWALSCLCM